MLAATLALPPAVVAADRLLDHGDGYDHGIDQHRKTIADMLSGYFSDPCRSRLGEPDLQDESLPYSGLNRLHPGDVIAGNQGLRLEIYGLRLTVHRRLDRGPVVLDPGVAGQGPHPDRVGVAGDLVQLGQPVDVDQVAGGGQAHVEQRDQALAAGQDLAVVADLGQHGQGLGHRARPVVLEHRWLHRRIISQAGNGAMPERISFT